MLLKEAGQVPPRSHATVAPRAPIARALGLACAAFQLTFATLVTLALETADRPVLRLGALSALLIDLSPW